MRIIKTNNWLWYYYNITIILVHVLERECHRTKDIWEFKVYWKMSNKVIVKVYTLMKPT